MATLTLTKSELSVLAGITEDYSKRQNIALKATQALEMSVPVKYDKSIENFTKRIIYYRGMNREDIRETEMTGKWLKILAKRVNIFLKGNELEPSENLAVCLAARNAKEYKELHPNYRLIGQLYRGIRAFEKKEFPSEDTMKGKILNMLFLILGVIDGRFGRRVLKPKYRKWWRVATYGTLTILMFIYIVIPFCHYWQMMVDYINWVRWGI